VRYPNITTVASVLDTARTASTQINGQWVPARPLGFMSLSSRLRAAWLVFTGRADALLWPGQ
jgi:hypothetical protein